MLFKLPIMAHIPLKAIHRQEHFYREYFSEQLGGIRVKSERLENSITHYSCGLHGCERRPRQKQRHQTRVLQIKEIVQTDV